MAILDAVLELPNIVSIYCYDMRNLYVHVPLFNLGGFSVGAVLVVGVSVVGGSRGSVSGGSSSRKKGVVAFSNIEMTPIVSPLGSNCYYIAIIILKLVLWEHA